LRSHEQNLSVVFWKVTPCNLVEIYRLLDEDSTLKMEAKDSLKTVVIFKLTNGFTSQGTVMLTGIPVGPSNFRPQKQILNKISRFTAPALRNLKVPCLNLSPRSFFLTAYITLPQSVTKHGGITLNPKDNRSLKLPYFLQQRNPGALPNTQGPRFITPAR